MHFLDARTLIIKAADTGVIQWVDLKAQLVAIYHQAGDEDHPEGWYADHVDDVAGELMNNEEGQKLLLGELKKKGVKMEWFDKEGWDSLCSILANQGRTRSW